MDRDDEAVHDAVEKMDDIVDKLHARRARASTGDADGHDLERELFDIREDLTAIADAIALVLVQLQGTDRHH